MVSLIEIETRNSADWHRVVLRRLPPSMQAQDEMLYSEKLWRLHKNYVTTDATSCVLVGGCVRKWLRVRVPRKSRLALDAGLPVRLEEIPVIDPLEDLNV